ncbi:hypothetical protein ACSUZJ_02530 [Telluria sp. B2]
MNETTRISVEHPSEQGRSARPRSTAHYYLGYLVAKEAGKRHAMQELARPDYGGARAAVQSALRGLREAARKSERDAQAASR